MGRFGSGGVRNDSGVGGCPRLFPLSISPARGNAPRDDPGQRTIGRAPRKMSRSGLDSIVGAFASTSRAPWQFDAPRPGAYRRADRPARFEPPERTESIRHRYLRPRARNEATAICNAPTKRSQFRRRARNEANFGVVRETKPRQSVTRGRNEANPASCAKRSHGNL